MWSMACVQGIWWGVCGEGGWRVVGVLVLVSGFRGGRVPGSGCLVGGGVRRAGPGSCSAGRGVRAAAPLRPLLNSPPRPLGVLWFLVRVVPLPGGGCCSPAGVLRVAVLFRGGGLVSRGVRLAGCVPVGFVLNLGEWLLFSLAVEVRPCGCRGCSVVRAPLVVFLVGVLFFCWLCCSRWAGRPGRSGSPSPPLSPPLYTTGLPRPPDSVGELTR